MYASNMDVHKTTGGTIKNIKKVNNYLKPFMDKLELIDIWREKNTTGRTFSYNAPNNASKLDNTLATDGNESNINIKYETLGNYDHKGIRLELMNYKKWGKGQWKLNVELLKNKDTIEKINTMIDNEKVNKHLHTPLQWWDNLKSKIKKLLIQIGIERKKEENQKIEYLNRQI